MTKRGFKLLETDSEIKKTNKHSSPFNRRRLFIMGNNEK